MRSTLLRAGSYAVACQVAGLVARDVENPDVPKYGKLALQVVSLGSGGWGLQALVVRKPHALFLARYVERFKLTPVNCSRGGVWWCEVR